MQSKCKISSGFNAAFIDARGWAIWLHYGNIRNIEFNDLHEQYYDYKNEEVRVFLSYLENKKKTHIFI